MYVRMKVNVFCGLACNKSPEYPVVEKNNLEGFQALKREELN